MATVYHKQGAFHQAALLYEQTAAIQKQLLGEKHIDYANTLQRLGDLYANLWDYKKAAANYQQAATVKKEVLGEKNPQYLNFLYVITQLYQMQNYLQNNRWRKPYGLCKIFIPIGSNLYR